MRLHEVIAGKPATVADRPAVIEGQTVLSYANLSDQVTALSGCLRKAGVGEGQKVALALPNSTSLLKVMLAVNAAGGVLIPMNPGLKPNERDRIFEVAQPDFVIADQGNRKLCEDAWITPTGTGSCGTDPELEDLCMLLFTSGTTGIPKGTMLTDENLLTNALGVVCYLRLDSADRTLVFLPLSYSYAISQCLSTLLASGTLVLLQYLLFPAEAFRLIEEHRVTGFGGVPTSLNILVNHASVDRFDLSSLRYVLNAGGPIAPSLLARLNRVFVGAEIFNNYGCTEIGPRATALSCRRYPGKLESVGRPIPGVEVVVICEGRKARPMEVGEIVVRGASLMKGYYRNPELTVQRLSPWGFHTGDLACVDDDGFLYVKGRTDDVFKCGGEKVSAVEIENVLASHPQVLEAAVVPEEDSRFGAVPVAYVVARGEEATAVEIQQFCSGRLSHFKVPRKLHLVKELAKGPTGKIQKFRLGRPEAVSS